MDEDEVSLTRRVACRRVTSAAAERKAPNGIPLTPKISLRGANAPADYR